MRETLFYCLACLWSGDDPDEMYICPKCGCETCSVDVGEFNSAVDDAKSLARFEWDRERSDFFE